MGHIYLVWLYDYTIDFGNWPCFFPALVQKRTPICKPLRTRRNHPHNYTVAVAQIIKASSIWHKLTKTWRQCKIPMQVKVVIGHSMNWWMPCLMQFYFRFRLLKLATRNKYWRGFSRGSEKISNSKRDPPMRHGGPVLSCDRSLPFS